MTAAEIKVTRKVEGFSRLDFVEINVVSKFTLEMRYYLLKKKKKKRVHLCVILFYIM